VNDIRVVTDSLTLLTNPALVRRYNITIVPAYAQFDDHLYRIGIDISQDEIVQRIRYGAKPLLQPPTIEDFLEAYRRLNREVTQIVSIHTSTRLISSVHHAQEATRMLLGRCNIYVIDSMTVSAGVGILVEQCARLAFENYSIDDIIREIRRMTQRLYTVFFVETMETISRQGLISESQTILGTMFGIMPFLTIEDGQLYIMEKVRNYIQAVDKIIEYIAEFTSVDQLVILSHAPTLTDPVRMLQDRLAVEAQVDDFTTQTYGAMLASLVGTDATGVVIFEGEEDDIEADTFG
jgi:DegV family protein with EDD domain